MRSAWLFAAVLLLAMALQLAACGGSPQKTTDPNSISTGLQTGSSLAVQGTRVAAGADLPEELKDFPVPPGFKTDSAGQVSQSGDTLSVGNWKGKGSVQAVSDFYRKAMAGTGWTEQYVVDTDSGSQQRTYSKADVVVIVDVEQQGEDVTVGVVQSRTTPKPTTTAH